MKLNTNTLDPTRRQAAGVNGARGLRNHRVATAHYLLANVLKETWLLGKQFAACETFGSAGGLMFSLYGAEECKCILVAHV